MRRMDFTTEHVESFQPGETYEVTECVLPSSYYYVLEHALGISKNFKNAERLRQRQEQLWIREKRHVLIL